MHFLTVVDTGNPRPRSPQDWCLGRVAGGWLPSHCVLMWPLHARRDHKLLGSLLGTLILLDQCPILMISFYPNYFSRDPVSKYSHTMGLGILWAHRHSVPNTGIPKTPSAEQPFSPSAQKSGLCLPAALLELVLLVWGQESVPRQKAGPSWGSLRISLPLEISDLHGLLFISWTQLPHIF